MHDHIVEMGMNIVRRLHPDNPNKHSRLWINKEIKKILANDLGTEETRYIHFDIGELSLEIAMQGLRKMKELRFLYLYGEYYDASESQNWKFNELPNALQYLYWEGYPFRSLPTTFQADNLVALEMPYSRIVQLWEGGERKDLNKLRFLNLSGSELRTFDLGVTPNLETLSRRSLGLSESRLRTLHIPNLEYLNLRNCHHLEEFHMADGCLKKLVYLNLSGTLRFESFEFQTHNGASCSEDESLEGGPLAELHLIAKSVDECHFHPNSNLPKFQFKCFYEEDRPLLSRNLEKLISVGLCACTNLDTFSRSVCGLQHLRKLKLEGSIPEAPKDLDLLQCLQQLDFSYTNIEVLPGSICKLKHLESLSLDGCWLLQKLPEDLSQLECLKTLTLSKTVFRELPDVICVLKHLESLRLRNCSLLEKLPEDLGRLECLEDLDLRGCNSLREVPDSIYKMKCLKNLHLSHCLRVEELPEEIGLLKCLKEIYVDDKGISHLPQSIMLLKGLRICGSRELLQSCGFTFSIPCLLLESDCFFVNV